MSAQFQTIAAFAIVVVTAAWLILRALARKKNPGCGGNCSAVSPEVKKIQALLKRQP